MSSDSQQVISGWVVDVYVLDASVSITPPATGTVVYCTNWLLWLHFLSGLTTVLSFEVYRGYDGDVTIIDGGLCSTAVCRAIF